MTQGQMYKLVRRDLKKAIVAANNSCAYDRVKYLKSMRELIRKKLFRFRTSPKQNYDTRNRVEEPG